jgi:hypothetical protein
VKLSWGVAQQGSTKLYHVFHVFSIDKYDIILPYQFIKKYSTIPYFDLRGLFPGVAATEETTGKLDFP